MDKERGPNLDLSTPNVETFRYTRVTFGVKCSPFLLVAVIRLHVEKYVNKYKRECELLNELYVDDLINSTSDTTEALQLSEDMIHILSEAATSSTTSHEAWKHEKCLICRRFKVMRRFPDNCGDLERLLRSTRDEIYGKVRSATIKTSTGIIKRPVQLLYNLEIVSNE
ncbi:integrase_H2C2 domain-containing protein [Trichonephila clavata]|uniref:Integrase_H2C2 domain-containing protein n=1 Tax=Trichonephila clavata TaxID=2740835 RepID=A0A8X6G1X7_TRICU|nr:integrase_H2C2 domain-containing protein [Trichonephila clavata]